MDENELELTNELENGISTDETTQDPPVELAEEANNQQPYWQSHDNYKKGFWKSEQDVLKAVDYYQTKFKPIETVLGQRGIKDHEGLNEIFSKYDEYSNPESDINLSYQALQNLTNHPTYGQKFNEFVSNIVEEAEMEKYGMRLPQEVKEKLQKIEEFENREKQREYETQVSTLETQIDQSVNQIKEFCQTKGLQISDDDLKAHMQECIDNNISIDRIYENFLVKNIDKLIGNVQSKTSKAVVNNIQNNAKSSIATGSRNARATETSLNSRADLRAAMENIFTNE